MLLTSTQLFHLPVFTRSGARVGTLSGFEFEAESQTILRYEIQTGSFFASRKALVHRNQVVSIGVGKMIVEDGSVPARERRHAIAMSPATESKPAPLTSSNSSTSCLPPPLSGEG